MKPRFVFRVVTLLSVVALLLNACSQLPVFEESQGRYTQKSDSAPLLALNPATIRDAIPRPEPITRAGNKSPYTVMGKTYTVLPIGEPYQAEGIASWYGTKFHGHQTSNGERYSLYRMTAAHKSLPIPSYVRVTNLQNGRSTVVRVNDRGPFHGNRIIDLSYAAATRLGYADHGTAPVRVELILPSDPVMAADQNSLAPALTPALASTTAGASRKNKPGHPQQTAEQITAAAPSSGHYLQAGAYKNYQSAHTMQQHLEKLLPYPVIINPDSNAWFRVQIGPVQASDIESIKLTMSEAQLPIPHRVSAGCESIAAC